MDQKWLKMQTFFETPGEGGGGGGGETPPAGETPSAGGPPAGGNGKDGPPVEDYSRPPDALHRIFEPDDTPPAAGPPAGWRPDYQATGPQPPPPDRQEPQPPPVGEKEPEWPSGELLATDPDKAMEMLKAHHNWALQHETSSLRQKVEEQDKFIGSMRESSNLGREQAFSRSLVGAYDAMNTAYEKVFNKDDDFRTNEELRNYVQDIIGYTIDRAIVRARHPRGDNTHLDWAANPEFYHRALAIAKDQWRRNAGGRITLEGAETVGPQGPRSTPSHAGLSEEMQASLAVARKEGFNYTEEQLAEALAKRNR